MPGRDADLNCSTCTPERWGPDCQHECKACGPHAVCEADSGGCVCWDGQRPAGAGFLGWAWHNSTYVCVSCMCVCVCVFLFLASPPPLSLVFPSGRCRSIGTLRWAARSACQAALGTLGCPSVMRRRGRCPTLAACLSQCTTTLGDTFAQESLSLFVRFSMHSEHTSPPPPGEGPGREALAPVNLLRTEAICIGPSWREGAGSLSL